VGEFFGRKERGALGAPEASLTFFVNMGKTHDTLNRYS
jgi:hypothetical protein